MRKRVREREFKVSIKPQVHEQNVIQRCLIYFLMKNEQCY